MYVERYIPHRYNRFFQFPLLTQRKLKCDVDTKVDELAAKPNFNIHMVTSSEDVKSIQHQRLKNTCSKLFPIANSAPSIVYYYRFRIEPHYSLKPPFIYRPSDFHPPNHVFRRLYRYPRHTHTDCK